METRILPAGGGYIEVLGIADAKEATASAFGNGPVRRLVGAGDGWLTWAVEVPDVEAVARRIQSPVTTLPRDGLTGVADAMREPSSLLRLLRPRSPQARHRRRSRRHHRDRVARRPGAAPA